MKQIITFFIVIFLMGCTAQQTQPAAQPAPATLPAEPAPVTIPTRPVQPTPAEPAQSPYEVMQEVSAPSGVIAPGPTNVPEPAILKQGYFHKVVHETNGRVQVSRALGGALSLNFIGFDTTPGPGLSVVLHSGDVKNGYVVGNLISHTGNYPYPLPNNLDVNKYTKVAIYNKKYNVIYGEADLK
ncbi:MAG: DM13 domain-containing protein [Candidatus Woesearchaeota archaeon]